MKNYILAAFAVGSIYLSFAFERKMETPQQQQETTLPEESLLWVANENSFSADSLVYQHLAMQYEPAAPVKKVKKKRSKKAAKTKVESRKNRQRVKADSVKLAYVADDKLQQAATQWLGTPYRSGNSTMRGTDCSGFVQRIYQQVYGVTLNRSSRSMYQQVQPIDPEDLREGDLVFFKRKTGPIYHVGIYLKDGKFIHSASNGGVMVNSLDHGYYSRNFYAAGRVAATN